jgi:hypothetical protein
VIRNSKGDWVSCVIVKSKRVVEYFNPRGRPSPDEDAVVLVFLKTIVSFVRNLKSSEGAARWNVAMSRVQHQRMPVDYGMYALIHQTSGMTLQKLNARRIGDKAAMTRRKTMFRAPWENKADKGNWENANEWERRFSGKDAEADKVEVAAYRVEAAAALQKKKVADEAARTAAAQAAIEKRVSKAAALQAQQTAQEQAAQEAAAAEAEAEQAAAAAAAAAVAAEADAEATAVAAAEQAAKDKVAEDKAAAGFAVVNALQDMQKGNFLAKMLKSKNQLTPDQIREGMVNIKDEDATKVTIKFVNELNAYRVDSADENDEMANNLTSFSKMGGYLLGGTGIGEDWRYAEVIFLLPK